MPTSALLERFTATRRLSEALCEPLTPEDCQIQGMPDVSPPKWHLAHTSWFFDEFILKPHAPGYAPFDAAFGHLFNSYYETVAPFWPRPKRGLLSRPSLADVLRYRAHVTSEIVALLSSSSLSHTAREECEQRLTLGIHHEQQHQELLVTDIKYNLSLNPLRPVYRPRLPVAAARSMPPQDDWIAFEGGLRSIGHSGPDFAFDNESPRHKIHLNPFALATRPVTNGEWKAFIDDGGYERSELWLSDGWQRVKADGWRAPLYWEEHECEWWTATLGGFARVSDAAPVCHVSYFEAQAYATWKSARLPTEGEWETAACDQPVTGNFLGTGALEPWPANALPSNGPLLQLFGDVWEWTQSAYLPYPGFRPLAGSLGEYNGKFMCNQMVSRGGSCATPDAHIRATYRNFFPPDARWQLSGVRLARDL